MPTTGDVRRPFDQADPGAGFRAPGTGEVPARVPETAPDGRPGMPSRTAGDVGTASGRVVTPGRAAVGGAAAGGAAVGNAVVGGAAVGGPVAGNAAVGGAAVPHAAAGSAAVGNAVVGNAVGAAPVAPAAGTASVSGAVAPGTARVAPARPFESPVRSADPDGPADAGRSAARSAAGPATDGGPRRGLRSELRRQVRERRRVRMIILLVVSVVILGALPLFFGIRAAMRDPVFAALDDLDLPAAVATPVDDRSAGSRWCFLECLFRERTARSSATPEETNQAYVAALTKAGWQRWNVQGCPEAPVDGAYTCWRRDEFTLDLWVRAPACPEPTPVDGKLPEPSPDCLGATVSIKVRNAVADERGRGPAPTPPPGQVGETPEAVPSVDPLPEATPSPS